jgi:hypothetical protein
MKCERANSSNRDDESHDVGLLDEHDLDVDTIQISSPEFWHGANVRNPPVIPNRVEPSICCIGYSHSLEIIADAVRLIK